MSRTLIPALTAACGLACHAQLRVSAWNISNYPGNDGREPSFKTILYTTYQGRVYAPDVVIAQEIENATGASAFLVVLNTAAGSPGDWALAQFFPGPDTNLAFYYRTSRITFLGQTLVLAGGNINGAPRDIRRYDVRPVGYTSDAATVAMYGDHMKAGSTGTDQDRRLVECQAIRANSNALPPGWQFLIGGDFNMQSSSQAAYIELTGSQASNRGRFFDPIVTPGTWNGSSAFRFVHTQAPGNTAGTGGMDDRFDFILLGAELRDGQGFDYIGNPAVPYSTTTWNDPNHSFRAWGNDGGYFNTFINTASNAMVGPAIATAINAACITDAAGGHLPVFLDLRVPPLVGAPASIDFGSVPQNSPAQQTLTVSNAGDTARWTVAGIANLNYSLAASSGLTAPLGNQSAAPGAPGNNHTITLSTSTPGPFAGTVTITSNDPDHPTFIVNVSAVIVAPATCYPNCDQSTTPPILNVQDFACFLNKYAAGDPYANCDASTTPPVLNVQDFSCFLNAFAQGCT